MTNYGYKGKTNDTQVALRQYPGLSEHVFFRLSKNSEIEYKPEVEYDSQGNAWYPVAYGYQKVGYMMADYINAVDTTINKYYMIEALNAFGNYTLVRGNVGDEVKALQRALNVIAPAHAGMSNLSVDGVFGANTENNVKAAQTAMHITSDGKVGPHTKARLYYCAYNRGGWSLCTQTNY